MTATPDMLCPAESSAEGSTGGRGIGGETGVMMGTGTGVSTGADGPDGIGGGGTADCGR